MYKPSILFIPFILLLPFSLQAANVCIDSDIHCSTLSGVLAKYIKIDSYLNGNHLSPFWMCAQDQSVISLEKQAVENGFFHVGDVVDFKYTQCDNRDCKRGIVIGYESFTIKTTSDNDYYSIPRTYVVNMKSKFGQTCSSLKASRDLTKGFRFGN